MYRTFIILGMGFLLMSSATSCLPPGNKQDNPDQEEASSQQERIDSGDASTLLADSMSTLQDSVLPGTAVSQTRKLSHSQNAKGAFPYNLNSPDQKFKLPGKLREISALSYFKEDLLATLQDEEGLLFFFDLKKGEVSFENKFGKRNDYEGLEIVGDTAFIIKSNGHLFEVRNFLDENPEVLEYNTRLRTQNNVEGMGYDPKTHRLLLACKNSPRIKDGPKYEGSRAVYAFDLRSRSLVPEPFLLINQDSLLPHLDEGLLTNFAKEIIQTLDDDVTFQPSGIARHPLSGDYYIIASVGKLIIVVNQEGKLLHVQELSKKVFKQPEGICFAPDGTLYISNEGEDGRGNILQFNYGSP